MASASDLYARARSRWVSDLDLSLYEVDEGVFDVIADLEAAVRQDPGHVPALTLLSRLVMQVGAWDDAREYVVALIRAEPGEAKHRTQLRLIDGADEAGVQEFLLDWWLFEADD